jgi:hypothetical protein
MSLMGLFILLSLDMNLGFFVICYSLLRLTDSYYKNYVIIYI